VHKNVSQKKTTASGRKFNNFIRQVVNFYKWKRQKQTLKNKKAYNSAVKKQRTTAVKHYAA